MSGDNDTTPARTFLSHEERLEYLKGIRDESLEWWADCAKTRTAKGISAAQQSYQDSTDEIERLEATLGIGDNSIDVVWTDPPAPPQGDEGECNVE